MMTPPKLMTVLGARPQFIKAAALSAAIGKDGRIDEKIVHTGQHFDPDLSAKIFAELSLPEPNHHLNISGGTHGEMTGRMLEACERVLIAEKPDAVLVYGDTNSSLAGALAAAKLSLPVFHVEAGLRSFNRSMPEEINRVLIDHLSTLLFCPTAHSVANLKNEGVVEGVHHSGDVMLDGFISSGWQSSGTTNPQGGSYVLLTLHRAENTEDRERFNELLDYVVQQAEGKTIIFPIHPRSRSLFSKYVGNSARVECIEPVSYGEMQNLIANAGAVFTDSGGLQKEAYFHRTPCVTLRSETEWVETIEAGWNRLWQVPDYAERSEIEDYGDGRASENIVDVMAQWFATNQ